MDAILSCVTMGVQVDRNAVAAEDAGVAAGGLGMPQLDRKTSSGGFEISPEISDVK